LRQGCAGISSARISVVRIKFARLRRLFVLRLIEY
jgi:hypothetical protein